MRRMYRYEVPVGAPSVHELSSQSWPRHVSGSNDSLVEFWAEHNDQLPVHPRSFVVVGTGQPVPLGGDYVGTTPRTPGGYVWHLYEVEGQQYESC